MHKIYYTRRRIEREYMLCDNCKQDDMIVVGQLASVKSSVLNMVKCWTCGYGSVRKQNTKRRLGNA